MKYPALTLRKGRLGVHRSNHPWVYKEQILKSNTSVTSGSLVSVLDNSGKFLGNGYYNPASEISVRILTFKDEIIDERFFHDRIAAAFKKREPLLKYTNAYRAVFSEADALPGLIIDLYDNTAVFQALTLGMDRFKSVIAECIKEILKPEYICEKSVSPFRKIEGLEDTAMWWGRSGKEMVEIFEGNAKFLVDIDKGHKTGFYLDQRNSRKALDGFSKNKNVLDLFCYTGAFSVKAALSGARKVLGVDIKSEWLELARKNASLNGVGGKAEFLKGDSFLALKGLLDSGEKFDLIIIDPPSFVKTKAAVASASKGYRELNLAAMKSLNNPGILATFSCSHNMPNEAFSGIIKDAAESCGKKLTILKRCHQAEDHPIVRSIPETEYLKGYFLKVEDK